MSPTAIAGAPAGMRGPDRPAAIIGACRHGRPGRPFHEDVTNRILNDFAAAAKPRWVEIVGEFNVHGGIKTEVRVTCGKRLEI